MTLTNSTPLIERAQNEDVTDDDIDPAAPPKRRTFTPEQKLAILRRGDRSRGQGRVPPPGGHLQLPHHRVAQSP